MSFKLDDSIAFWINVVALKLKGDLNRSLSQFDITVEQWAILNRLWEEDGVTQKDLAERTGKDQPNTGRILDKLEKKQLVTRRPDQQDRRMILVFLTPYARELKDALIPHAVEVLNRAQKDISEEELQVLRKVLQQMSRNL